MITVRAHAEAFMDPDRVAALREDFEAVDTDGDGWIAITEFRELLAELGSAISGTQLRSSFSEADTDGDERIDVNEFCSWWLNR